MSGEKAVRLLLGAANDLRTSPARNGQIMHLPASGELLVLGDLHNHTRNYERLKTVAALAENPERHVLMQEIIHGGVLGPKGEDSSVMMLLDALDWAHHFPGRVHFILANHDWAQAHGMAIMKDGYDLTDRFTRGLAVHFGHRAADVSNAFHNFVYSLPLAMITASGILFTHSLPGPRDLDGFDTTVLRRPLEEHDYRRLGPVYQLIWGRAQTQAVLDRLSRAWWSDLFVCGHQAQEAGHGTLGDRMLMIDSSHNHGVFLPVDLGRQYTLADLQHSVMPLAAVG